MKHQLIFPSYRLYKNGNLLDCQKMIVIDFDKSELSIEGQQSLPFVDISVQLAPKSPCAGAPIQLGYQMKVGDDLYFVEPAPQNGYEED